MSRFPVDIWSVKKYGVEQWHKKFFWPVTNQEFQDLHRKIRLHYLDIAMKAPLNVSDSLLVLYGLGVIETSLFLHTAMVVQRLQRQGISPYYHPSNEYYKALCEGEPIPSSVGRSLPGVPTLQQKLWWHLRALIGNLKGYSFNFSNKSTCLATNNSKKRMEQFSSFAKSHGEKLKIVFPVQFFPASIKRTKTLSGAKQSVECFTEGLNKIAAEHDIKIEERHIENFNEIIINSMHYIADYIEGIVQILNKRERTSILVNAIGNISKRSLCIAGKRAGFHVVGFTHGDAMGISKSDSFAYIEQIMVNTFVVPSRGSVELNSLLAEKYLHTYGRDIKIVANQTGSYAKIKELVRKEPQPPSISRVMLVEFPLDDKFHAGTYGPFWSYQLDLNLRIVKLLRQHGFKTILKKHPDRLRESEFLYDHYYDELLSAPFEDVYDQTDAFIFPNIMSTTFSFALLTDRPCIIFESLLEDVWKEAGELLKKRCRVVPSWINEDGRLMFDQNALIEVVSRPWKKPNDEFIERYVLT